MTLNQDIAESANKPLNEFKSIFDQIRNYDSYKYISLHDILIQSNINDENIIYAWGEFIKKSKSISTSIIYSLVEKNNSRMLELFLDNHRVSISSGNLHLIRMMSGLSILNIILSKTSHISDNGYSHDLLYELLKVDIALAELFIIKSNIEFDIRENIYIHKKPQNLLILCIRDDNLDGLTLLSKYFKIEFNKNDIDRLNIFMNDMNDCLKYIIDYSLFDDQFLEYIDKHDLLLFRKIREYMASKCRAKSARS